MLKLPEQLTFEDKKFSMILYGQPGVGKTTLALSAPEPVLIDFDRGVDRVKAYHRTPTIVCDTYEDVLEDIQSPIVAQCKTIVIDTGGSFVTMLKDWAFRNKPEARTKGGDFNSLKGFGIVKNEFASFTARLRDVMHKNVIYIFHTVEEKDKEGNPQQRLLCEGASKNSVWTSADFGAYFQMIDGKRVLCFSPTQEYFAKGCHGITGMHTVPDIDDDTKPNDFLTRMFAVAIQNIEADNQAGAAKRAEYDAVMAQVNEILGAIETVEDANAAANRIKSMQHTLTSKAEASAMLRDRTKDLGFKWDKINGCYVEEKSGD